MRWNSSSSAWWSPSCCWACSCMPSGTCSTSLPTSFVPQEDQGYAMVAIIMPQAASLERTQAVAERADAILAKIPGVATRSMITGYSLVDAGFKTNAATFFITFKDFKERYADIATAKAAERARHPHRLLRRGQAHPRGRRAADRAAGHSRHRHHRRLRVLDPGHRRRLAGGAGQPGAGLPGQGAAAARTGRRSTPPSTPTRSSCAPTSTARRRCCCRCRCRTCTARSRRSSARSPPASSASTAACGG